MANILAGGIVRVAARLQYLAVDDMINVFSYRNDTAGPVDYAQVIADISEGLDNTYELYEAVLSNQFFFRDLAFWDVGADAPMGIVPWPDRAQGTVAGDMMPSQVAGFVYFRTHRKRCIGKKFLPGVPESGGDSTGSPATGYLSVAQLWGNAILSSSLFPTPEDWTFVVLSTVDALYYEPYQAVVATRFSTLRRRKLGVGS